jgi:hypothetical protein
VNSLIEKIQHLETEIQKLKAENEALETKSFKFWKNTITLSEENLDLKQENEDLKQELSCAQTFLKEKGLSAQKRDTISEKVGEILDESQNRENVQEEPQEKNAFSKNMSKEKIQQTQKPSDNAPNEEEDKELAALLEDLGAVKRNPPENDPDSFH